MDFKQSAKLLSMIASETKLIIFVALQGAGFISGPELYKRMLQLGFSRSRFAIVLPLLSMALNDLVVLDDDEDGKPVVSLNKDIAEGIEVITSAMSHGAKI